MDSFLNLDLHSESPKPTLWKYDIDTQVRDM
jgi:hypothetical protein